MSAIRHSVQRLQNRKTSAQRKAIRTCWGDRILQFSQLRPGLPFREGGLFLTANYKKRTWQYLPDTVVSLKMGDFNTPSVFHFFKRTRRLWILYFKTAARLLFSVHGAPVFSRQNNGFFICRVWCWVIILRLDGCIPASLKGFCFWPQLNNLHLRELSVWQ